MAAIVQRQFDGGAEEANRRFQPRTMSPQKRGRSKIIEFFKVVGQQRWERSLGAETQAYRCCSETCRPQWLQVAVSANCKIGSKQPAAEWTGTGRLVNTSSAKEQMERAN